MRENARGSRRIAALLASLMTSFLLGGPAHSQPTSATMAELYEQGHYLEAAAEAERAATADDLAFASRSLMALCMTIFLFVLVFGGWFVLLTGGDW